MNIEITYKASGNLSTQRRGNSILLHLHCYKEISLQASLTLTNIVCGGAKYARM